MYNLKFDAVRSQLEHAIQHSTETILSRVRENGIMRLRFDLYTSPLSWIQDPTI